MAVKARLVSKTMGPFSSGSAAEMAVRAGTMTLPPPKAERTGMTTMVEAGSAGFSSMPTSSRNFR